MRLRVAKNHLMEGGYEGSPLPAGGDIPATEVGDDGNPGFFSQECRVAKLQRIALIGSMPDSLSMAPDGPYIGRRYARLAHDLSHGLRIQEGQHLAQ